MNTLVGVWNLINRILPRSKDTISHNLKSEMDSAKAENVYDNPQVLAMIKESDKKQKIIATIMSGSSFEPRFQNWLWFTLFIVKIEAIREVAFQERIWQDDFWARFFPAHLAINPNGANRKKFFEDIATYATVCLDPDLPFIIRTTDHCGIGIFPTRPIVDPNDGFLEYLYGFSFSMSCRYATQLQECDMISDIVSITVAKNNRGLQSYYWICGPIGFVNHSCIASHCLVTVPSSNYMIGPFNADDFAKIRKSTKYIYTCMDWSHVDNSVYTLKTVKMWDGKTEFVVRYTYEGFGFQKMKCLCAYCYSEDKPHPKRTVSSIGYLGTSVSEVEDSTSDEHTGIVITDSFDCVGLLHGDVGTEGISSSSSSTALTVGVSSKSQLKKLSDCSAVTGQVKSRTESFITDAVGNVDTPAAHKEDLTNTHHATLGQSSNPPLSAAVSKKRGLSSSSQEETTIQPRRLADNVPNYQKFVKLKVEYDSRGNKMYTPPVTSFGAWTK